MNHSVISILIREGRVENRHIKIRRPGVTIRAETGIIQLKKPRKSWSHQKKLGEARKDSLT